MYIKVKYINDGVQSKKEYTFESDVAVEVGEEVSVGKATAVVTEIDVPEDEVAAFKDKIKKIDGKVEKTEED